MPIPQSCLCHIISSLVVFSISTVFASLIHWRGREGEIEREREREREREPESESLGEREGEREVSIIANSVSALI